MLPTPDERDDLEPVVARYCRGAVPASRDEFPVQLHRHPKGLKPKRRKKLGYIYTIGVLGALTVYNNPHNIPQEPALIRRHLRLYDSGFMQVKQRRLIAQVRQIHLKEILTGVSPPGYIFRLGGSSNVPATGILRPISLDGVGL